MSKRLGELLVQAKLISQEQLKTALDRQRETDTKLGTVLVQLGFITEDEITEVLADQYGVPSVNLANFDIDPDVLKMVPAEVVRRYLLIPISRTGSSLTVAMADPTNVFAQDDIKFMTGYNVIPVVASEIAIERTIRKYYGTGKSIVGTSMEMDEPQQFEVEDYAEFEDTYSEEDIDEGLLNVGDFDELVSGAMDEIEVVEDDGDDALTIEDMEAPIVKLVNGILIKAINNGVSDIHIEPFEKSFRVRYRLDGVLRKELSLPLKIRNAVTSRVKIMASLDISEKRLPQDGRIKMRLGPKKEIDFRVSTLPVLFGEKIVLRILDKSNLEVDMTKLGFEPQQLAEFQEAIHKPYGMVLVSGPTGSGKTTTLYSALSQLNTISDNIMTAEDPVEYNLIGINQVQMKESIGLTFAASLRAFLRQDPDIIMVGEIRDFDTAETAIKAALTGHLVLSTIHTNDAPSTINRLLNMGIEPFLVSSSLILVQAQRLCRRICSHCKEPVTVPPEALLDIGFQDDEVDDMVVHKGKGCNICTDSGYKGRIALFEVMPLGDEVRELVLRGASSMEIKETAVALGMRTLRDSGLQKIRDGVTTIEEVVRVTFGQ